MRGARESNRPRKERRASVNRRLGRRSMHERCPRCKKLRRKWVPANNWHEGRTRWQRRPEGLVCWICVEREPKKERTDTERLEWLVCSGAHVAHSRDGDTCWLHWAYNPDDEEGEAVNQKGAFNTPREAIDAAMDEAGK